MLRYTPIQAKEQVEAKVAKMIQSLEKRELAIIVADCAGVYRLPVSGAMASFEEFICICCENS